MPGGVLHIGDEIAGRRPAQGAATAMTLTRVRPAIATCAVLLLTVSQPLDETAAETSAGGGSQSASVPTFEVDPFWPRELPADWLLGNVVGVATDSSDNVWIIHRPNSQRGGEHTPPVIAFAPAGNVIHAWGSPGDGYDWGTQTHGIHVDHEDNVWVGFGGGLPYDLSTRATTDNAHVLKFTPEGEFLLQIGDFGRGTEGSGSTEFLGQPTDVFVDPASDEVYISDGYTNRRLIVFDANRGEYRRHWSAYGNPPDDGLQPRFSRDGPLPQQFNTPHCVGRAADGRVYVCDRGNQRLQVFEPDGTFVAEALIAAELRNGTVGGTPWDLAFSRDPAQRFIFVADGGNHAVHTLSRETLEVVATFGRRGRWAGQFESPHSLAIDSRGNLFVGETLDGRRVQKFVPAR
ncbi:MAG: hypothetical protein F4Y14_12345 [Acidobacteria bacterium]|nr:hypothetical protein [Acidobacteriota bacterium]